MLADNLTGLDGLLVGIVGFGMIGVAVAEAFHRLGCRICLHDPAPPNPAAEASALPPPARRLLRTRRHGEPARPAPASDQRPDRRAQLASMKPDAVLIQASRGGVVDEAALAAALAAGKIGGAAVDVYLTEPPPPDNPLLTLDGESAQRLLLTPHIAGVTRQSSAFLFRAAWQQRRTRARAQ